MAQKNRDAHKRDHEHRKDADDLDVPDNWAKNLPLSPSWWAPTFITLLVVGLAWIVIYYFSGAAFPIPGIGHWNLGIGFVFMLAGFGMTLWWK